MRTNKKHFTTKPLRPRSKRRARRGLHVEALESRRLLATALSGMVFDDVNADGAYQPQSGETPIEGATVYVDVNNDGVLSDVAITVEPDSFVDTAILNNRTPGVTLRTADRFNNRIFDVTSKSVTQTSTGTQAFAHENIAFWMLDRKLRIDLDSPGRSIGIDFIGGIANAEKGTLEIYDSDDQLLDSFTTGDITLGQVATMTLERTQGDIAYAIAYTSVGSRGQLDNLRINHLGPQSEPFAVTDADGQYTISSDLTGTFAIRKAREDGVLQTLPTTRDLPSVLIAVEDRRDHLFDSERGVQYIATGHGTIERYHVATETMMAPLYVGGSLRGMDLSPDGNFLYVGEENLGPETGFVRKINLETLEKTNISYPISGDESGVRDLTIAENGKALFSITFDGSGSVPLWALDLASDQVQTSMAGVEQFTLFSRSYDRSLVFVHGSNSHPNTIRTYDPDTDTYPASRSVDNVVGATSAVSRDGSLIAFHSFSDGLSVMDASLNTVEILPNLNGGLAFDPTRDILYAVDASTDQVVAFDTVGFQELYRIEIGEDVSGSSALEPTVMSISDDSRWMFLSTPSGVRMLQLEGADAYVVSLTSSSSIGDLDFGCVNYESGLRETAKISGQKWEDLDRDGRYEPGDGEQPIAGVSVYLDLNGNQQWDEAGVGIDQGIVVEPDDFSDEFVLNRHFAGVTLSTTDQNNVPIFKVTANDDPNASTGKFVFGHANIPFWQDTRRLRMDFNSPTRYVAIDFIGALAAVSTTGRLEIYNSTGVLAGTYETQPLFDGQVERMELALADEDISYAVAYVPAGLGNFGRLDNLRFAGPALVSEPLQVTDPSGQYAFDGLQPGTYRVAEMQEPGWQQTYPLGIAKESLLIDVPEVRDHIYDSTREMLLIATSDGKIQRFDLSTRTLETPFNVGAELNGIDLSLDNNYAYVGEVQTSPSVGFVRKVNLNDGTKTNIQFTISGQEGGVKDLAIADNDLGLFSILFNGSGSVPLFELDLGTNATTPRIPDLSQHLLINRSMDRSLLVLHGSNGHPDEIFTYDPDTDSFSPSKAVGNVIGSTSAVNHDGSLIAFRSVSGGVSVLDPQLTTLEVYAQLKGGLGFNATGDRFFAIDDDRDELVVYEALSSKPMFSLPLGEDVGGFSTFEPTVLSVTGDGQFLFVTTPSGVRMYDVQEAIPHVITVGYGDHVEGIDFGNTTNGDNRRPTAADDQYEVDEDDELTVAAKGVLTNDDDPDGDTLSAVLLDEPLHGEVTLNANGSFTYIPDPGYFGNDQFEYAASDGNLQSNTATVDISIRSLNDAPSLIARAPSAITNEELARTLAVADFVNNGAGTTQIQDDDSQDPVGGIALTSAAGNGGFSFSLDGTNFSPIGAVSNANALLLPETAWIRYQPDGENGESASLVYRGWDQTSGIAGQHADAVQTGGATAFSANTDTLSINVADVNDAPVLMAGAPSRSTDEDTAIEVPLADFINNGAETSQVDDVDQGDPIGGIAITGLSGDGTWQFSLDGSTFTDVGSLTPSTALLLPSTAILRYAPVGENLETASLPYRAWDGTQGTAGGSGDATSHGGSTAFSSNTDTLTIDVQAVNDAPQLLATGPSADTDENTPYTFELASWVNAGANTTTITDVDTGAALGGVAIAGTTGRGQWRYSTDGINFVAVGVVSSNSALLLPADAWLQYLPDELNGETAAVTYHAWDTTSGVAEQKVSLAVTGGSTAFSTASDTGSIEVFPVNDAPELLAGAPQDSTDEDTTITVPISAVVNNGIGTTTMADVDDGDDVGGIAVTSTVGEGQWSYSLDGQNFTDMNGVATANALLLPDDASLRYVPNGLYSESASITYVAWDTTSGQAGQQTDASTRGDHTSFSLDSDTLTIQVTDVNDAPTLITLSSSSVPENTTGDEIGDVTADDPDPGDSHSFTVSDNRFEVVGGKLKLKDSQAVDFESEGTIDVTVTAADDGVPVMDYSQGFTITVIDQNDAPTVAVPLEDQTAYVTRPFEFEVVETTFADEDAGDHLTYSASMVDGSPLPAWLNFDPTDRTFRGTPSVLDAGSLEIRVTVTDAGTPSMNVHDDLTLVVDDNPFPWQNPILNVDVDDKDGVIPLDALIIINYINLHPGDTSLPDPPAAPPPYYDVNGDNAIAAIDALQVINYLNDQIEGEGESTTSAQTLGEDVIVAHFSPGQTAAPPQEPTWDKPEAEAHRQANEDADNDWRGRTGQQINRSEEERCTDALDGHRYRSNHDIDESIDSILDDFVTETARRWYRVDGRR